MKGLLRRGLGGHSGARRLAARHDCASERDAASASRSPTSAKHTCAGEPDGGAAAHASRGEATASALVLRLRDDTSPPINRTWVAVDSASCFCRLLARTGKKNSEKKRGSRNGAGPNTGAAVVDEVTEPEKCRPLCATSRECCWWSERTRIRGVISSLPLVGPVRSHMCGGSRDEHLMVQNHPFADRSNLGGLSGHYFAQECGPSQMTGDGLMPGALSGTEVGRIVEARGEQLTGKRGWEDGVDCAKRARTHHFGASTDACICDAPGVASADANFVDMGDVVTMTPAERAAPVSVYEQYLQREREREMAAAAQAGLNRQAHAESFRCPSGWSGTEWECCPGAAPFAQQSNGMDCDRAQDHSLYNASMYGDLYPRGC